MNSGKEGKMGVVHLSHLIDIKGGESLDNAAWRISFYTRYQSLNPREIGVDVIVFNPGY